MRDVCDSLMDIINAIDAAQAFIQNMDEATFAADQRTQYAVTYALMIVGEAPSGFQTQCAAAIPLFHGG